MVKIKMAGYLADITVEIENALTEMSDKVAKVRDMKTYGSAASAHEYARGLFNGVVHIGNAMPNGYENEMLQDMIEHWEEKIGHGTEILLIMKNQYWKGGNDDGEAESDGTDGTGEASDADPEESVETGRGAHTA